MIDNVDYGKAAEAMENNPENKKTVWISVLIVSFLMTSMAVVCNKCDTLQGAIKNQNVKYDSLENESQNRDTLILSNFQRVK